MDSLGPTKTIDIIKVSLLSRSFNMKKCHLRLQQVRSQMGSRGLDKPLFIWHFHLLTSQVITPKPAWNFKLKSLGFA